MPLFLEFVLILVLVEILLNILSLQQKRDSQFHPVYNKNNKTVLCVGDSHTYGLGAEPNESYPKHLERILNSQNKKLPISVINEGVCGFNTTRILEKLPQHLSQYNPDIVLLLAGDSNYWYRYGFDRFKNKEKTISLWEKLKNKIALLKLIQRRMNKSQNHKIQRQPDKGCDKFSKSMFPTPLPEIANMQISDFNSSFISNSPCLASTPEECDTLLKKGYNTVNTHESEFYLLACVKGNSTPDAACAAIRKLISIYYTRNTPLSIRKNIFLAVLSLQLQPQTPSFAYSSIGSALTKLKKFEKAWTWIYKSIESNPTNESTYLDVYRYLSLLPESKQKKMTQIMISQLDKLPKENTCINNFIKSINGFNTNSTEQWIIHDIGNIISLSKKHGSIVVLMNYHSGFGSTLNQAIATASKKYNAPLINISLPFSYLSKKQQQQYMAPDLHMNSKGNRYQAQIIAQNSFIQEKLGINQ